MEKETKRQQTSHKKDLRSLDIPWWIGGPKVIASSAKARKLSAENR